MSEQAIEIRTAVRCFRYGYTFSGCPRKQLWAMWSETDGWYFDDLNKLMLPSVFTINQLRQSEERSEIPPAQALDELAAWPEGQAELRRLFAEWPAEPKVTHITTPIEYLRAASAFVYPSGFAVGQRVRIDRDYPDRKYNAHIRPDFDWGIVAECPGVQGGGEWPADAVQVKVRNQFNDTFSEGTLDAAMLSAHPVPVLSIPQRAAPKSAAAVQAESRQAAKVMSKYDIAKEFSAGFCAALTPEPWCESNSQHWRAGYNAGYGIRKEKNERLNKYLASIGVETMGVVKLYDEQKASKQ